MTDDGSAVYEELDPIDRKGALRTLGEGVPGSIGSVLLRLALHDPDLDVVQRLCIEHSRSPEVWDRRNCATAIGHLARIHRRLSLNEVVPVLTELGADPEVHSWVEAAFDDLEVFLGFTRRGNKRE